MADLVQEAKQVLARLGATPKKSFGQNFMSSPQTLLSIADSLSIQPGETVLEIGPGLGFLTQYLIEKGAQVLAVEKDSVMAGYLLSRFKEPTFRVSCEDIRYIDLSRDFKLKQPIQVVGNIPYHLTSEIVEWLIHGRPLISRATLTVQWEVAQRLCSEPGGKIWGALSIFVQYYAELRLIKKISRTCFYPAPKVDSALIQLSFFDRPRVQVKDEDHFFSVVRHAFQKRRKTLLNALGDKHIPSLPKEALLEVLKSVSIDPSRRPETLSILEWAALSDQLPIQFKT